jgi:hypothetical protein
MDSATHRPLVRRAALCLFVAFVLARLGPGAQELTGVLIGTLKDQQGGIVRSADIRLTSPAIIGGSVRTKTNEKGQLRFLALAPGMYALDIDVHGFEPYHEEGIPISAGGTVERAIVLNLPRISESLVVRAPLAASEARDSGFATGFRLEEISARPTRRASMFDFIRAAPGVSPTSPSSGTTTTVSVFGSGTNENQYLVDGTPTTCPCNGIARSEIGIEFIQEVRIQALVASAEFGNTQGAVINVITRQGGSRFQYDASYYAQSAGLTSRPIRLPLDALQPEKGETGYARGRYRDGATTLGGPIVRDRLWFFTGYQYLRDYDNQPGTDAAYPRAYEQDKLFAKLTWKLGPVQLLQSVHHESLVNPDTPTFVTPFEATRQRNASVPAMTPAHLTHIVSSNTVWEARVGRFVYDEERTPSTGDWTRASRFNRATNVTTGAPPLVGDFRVARTTGKATVSYYRPDLFGADHQWKIGASAERGEQHGSSIVPTGARFVDDGDRPIQSISSEPSNIGGMFVTAAVFLSDAVTVGDRVTANAGVRFDHSRAVSQDLSVPDAVGRDTGAVVEGLGTLFTWNEWSPRLGLTAKVTHDGRTMLRASYGRFTQGVFTGEISPFHPGSTPSATRAFETATGDYTRIVKTVDPRVNLRLDREIQAPRTHEYSVALSREIGRGVAVATTYVHKRGNHFIGWIDTGGRYREELRTLADGRSLPVFVLVNSPDDQRFLLTNPPGYSLKYDGVVIALQKRESSGWHASGSYTLSRTSGLQPSSGELAAGAQASTIATPTRLFGRDPNDLTNAQGRLPNDRPHVFRVMGSADIRPVGVVVAANLQHFSGKPWAATTQINLQQLDHRILLEPRGSRRLSSQTLLDVRLSRRFTVAAARIDVLFDLLNALNDTAEEALASDNLFSPTFGQPTLFVDPRRAMLGVRLNLNRQR